MSDVSDTGNNVTKAPSCPCRFKISTTTLFKLFQMISVSVTFGLFRGIPLTFGRFGKADPILNIMTHADVFAGGVMVTAFICTPLMFLSQRIAKEGSQRTYLEPLINISLCLFSLVSGFIGLAFWKSPPSQWSDDKAEGITMCCFCFVTAVFYFLDTLGVLGRILCRKTPTV
ncbi:hypothetical protein SK128_024067 [Halocaridina rubra]|uniref:MARVEL domain-containing protein n=1 Tax=Halocaridina rubra TaxID=373956 RepID=A0AAN8WSI9_HALRR